MKDKRSSPVDKIIPLLIMLGFSLFCGFVGIANGLGTLTSPLNRAAGPMVCGDRQLEIEQDNSAYIQGEQTTRITAYCVDGQTGEKQDASNELFGVITKLQIATGILSSLIIFFLAMLFLNWAAHRLNTTCAGLFQPSVRKQ